MPGYVQIAVNVPSLSGEFDYHVPPELESKLSPGSLVAVPFGKQTVQGVVLRPVLFPSVTKTRPVLELLEPQPVLTPAQIALAEQLSEETLAPLAACIQVMLPPGLSKQADTEYSLSGNTSNSDLPDTQKRILGLLLERGTLRGRQIENALPRKNWRNAVQALEKRGLVKARPVLPAPTARAKQARVVQLAVSVEEAQAALPSLGRQGAPALVRRQAMLQFLIQENKPVEATWVYAAGKGGLEDLRQLEARGLVILGEAETYRDPLADLVFIPTSPPPLTQDQIAAWEQVSQALHYTASGKMVPPLLLHGVTGSGKTEIYMHATALALQQGRQVIMLVPEIAMTPQTVQRFLARFPGQVGLMHSRLSDGERYDTWRRARQGQVSILVGPRSALFTPFPNLGLIIVDECHDDSYYQSDLLPHYHAREGAVAYAMYSHAVCLLGSATPDLESRYRADQGKWHYIHLPERILAHKLSVQSQLAMLKAAGAGPEQSAYRPLSDLAETTDLPPVHVVDMRQELKAGNRSIFSRRLQESLKEVLNASQQAILFLNRRGTATYVFCRACGHTLTCPRCDIPLTYHTEPVGKIQAAQALFCHRCGYRRNNPKTCPECGSPHIRHYGTGTERVEDEVQAMFPKARTLRWDYETTRAKGSHEAILHHFSTHQADVLIGTQMIAKGLDLPFVTLVGMVLADAGLALPDLRAGERGFQLLTQVAGRAGRSPLGGQAILQTFNPEHYVIQAAASHDYAGFYLQELARRRQMGYPPFARLVRMEIRQPEAARAEAAALGMATQLRGWLASEDDHLTELIGPAPCFFAQVDRQHRWQIILRGPDPTQVLRGRLANLPADWRIEVNPPSLL